MLQYFLTGPLIIITLSNSIETKKAASSGGFKHKRFLIRSDKLSKRSPGSESPKSHKLRQFGIYP